MQQKDNSQGMRNLDLNPNRMTLLENFIQQNEELSE